MNSVGIIGFGRFGKVLANILEKGFTVRVFDVREQPSYSNVEFVDLNSIIKEKNIFIAVPIREFFNLIKKIAPKLNKNIIIDVCSIKIYPVKIMNDILPDSIDIIATHPMFGPDSFNVNKKLKMMMFSERDKYGQYNFWKHYFSDQGIDIFEMSPEKHDRLAASTQGITHYLGRMLKEFGIQKTNLDTQGFIELLDLVEQTCNDSWELFSDLQKYNPYTDKIVNRLTDALRIVGDKLKKEKMNVMEN